MSRFALLLVVAAIAVPESPLGAQQDREANVTAGRRSSSKVDLGENRPAGQSQIVSRMTIRFPIKRIAPGGLGLSRCGTSSIQANSTCKSGRLDCIGGMAGSLLCLVQTT